MIDANPSYIVWCIQNVRDFVIDKRLSEELVAQYEGRLVCDDDHPCKDIPYALNESEITKL